MSSCYTTVTASVVQVASAGALGAMINNLRTREIDIFASSYFTTRNFAHGHERESTDQPIYATKTNNIKNKFEITRSFDLIYQLFLCIDLPGIRSFSKDEQGAYKAIKFTDENAEAGLLAHYTNGVAAALINEVHICMGGHSLSKLTGEQIFLYEELAGRPGKRLLDMVGKSVSTLDLAKKSARAQRLYLPLYFFFCATRGSVSSALNLIGAQFQKATIDMSLKSLCSVIENGDDENRFISKNAGNHTTWVVDEVSTESMTAPVRAKHGDISNAREGSITSYENARITLDVLGITLNEEDRNTFAQKDRMSLMDEVTVIDRSGTQALKSKSETITITDEAKNLIYELQIAARVQNARSRRSCNPSGDANATPVELCYVPQGPMRFDGSIDATTGETSEPLSTIALSISGQARTQPNLEAAFYNMVTPYLSHSTLPSQKGIYSVPISLYPEDWNVPDSYMNSSKLDSIRLTLTLPDNVQSNIANYGGVDVRVFCHTYNVLVEQKGMKARFFV